MWVGLFLVFVAVPLLELALLIKLGQWIGLWPTISIIILTAGLGIAIVQQQGFTAFRRAAENMSNGTPPVESAIDGFMLMMAGGLLIAPGILTDLAGLLLLIPPVRKAVARWSLSRMQVSGSFQSTTWTTRSTARETGADGRAPNASARTDGGPVIEGEFKRIDEKPKPGKASGDDGQAPYRNGHARE